MQETETLVQRSLFDRNNYYNDLNRSKNNTKGFKDPADRLLREIQFNGLKQNRTLISTDSITYRYALNTIDKLITTLTDRAAGDEKVIAILTDIKQHVTEVKKTIGNNGLCKLSVVKDSIFEPSRITGAGISFLPYTYSDPTLTYGRKLKVNYETTAPIESLKFINMHPLKATLLLHFLMNPHLAEIQNSETIVFWENFTSVFKNKTDNEDYFCDRNAKYNLETELTDDALLFDEFNSIYATNKEATLLVLTKCNYSPKTLKSILFGNAEIHSQSTIGVDKLTGGKYTYTFEYKPKTYNAYQKIVVLKDNQVQLRIEFSLTETVVYIKENHVLNTITGIAKLCESIIEMLYREGLGGRLLNIKVKYL